jgi:hypothetical protein
MYLNKPNEVSAYQLVWDDIDNRALDESESQKMISAASKGFTHA